MILILQLVLFCLLFTLMVRLSAIGGGINALYFYPKEVQQKAFSLGLTDEKTMKRKKTMFFYSFSVCASDRTAAYHRVMERRKRFLDGIFSVAPVS